MANSPLIIDGYHLSELLWKEPLDPTATDRNAERNFEVNTRLDHHPDDKSAFRIQLQVTSVDDSESPNVPTFSATYVGFFRVAEGYPEEMREQLAAINGPSILYAAAREILMLLSGRTGAPFVLPSISFVNNVVSASEADHTAKRAKVPARKKRTSSTKKK